MGKKLRIVLIVVFVLIVGFAIIVQLQPAEYQVLRTMTTSARPATVFAQVNNFHKWEAWSPWAKLDPNATTTFDGPPAGTGAIYSWAGNDKVGAGTMTIIQSRPNEMIRIKLDFTKPFASTSTSEFMFDVVDGQTVVRWRMSGEKNFMSKAFCLFHSMDKMIGGDFERGLDQLKTVSEAATRR
jgi:uncharacterized protein YndB with AHSA1/START domain